VSTVGIHRVGDGVLAGLIDQSPASVSLTDDHRRSLAARFRAVPSTQHRRVDAWLVEHAGRSASPFAWTPASARRTLATSALRRCVGAPGTSLREAVESAIDDQCVRALSGVSHVGSLARFLGDASSPVRALCAAEALTWAVTVLEVARGLATPWSVAPCDLYYDVAGARTSLRARRDVVVARGDDTILIRLRPGAPGPSAGPGLRADLCVAALAAPDGRAPARLIGAWPDAGVLLAIDPSMADLRAGARDLVRAAVVLARPRALIAA